MSEYTTQETALLTGVTIHTLRYYERLGLILDIRRDSNNYRRYSEADIEWIRFLLQLKATGMPLTKMQIFADLRRRGDHTARQRREMLEAHRKSVEQQISNLNDCLTMIDYKIDIHRQKENLL